MQKEMDKCEEKVKMDENEQNKKNFDTCKTYMEEIKMIKNDFTVKKKDLDKLLNEFEKDVPELVYTDRDKRLLENDI